MRNRITWMVVVEEAAIEVATTKNHQQPGLLRTCKQLRVETVSVFENENDSAF